MNSIPDAKDRNRTKVELQEPSTERRPSIP